MKKKDLGKIVAKYELGELRYSNSIERRLSTLNPSFIINTAKGNFFLKAYTKQFKKFRYHILKGLDLLIFLERKNYPSIRVILAKNKKPYVVHNGITFAVFEFMDIKEKKAQNKKQAYEMGKYLGMLHLLAKNFPVLKKGQGYNSFKKELDRNFYLSKGAPDKYRATLDYLKKYYSGLKVPSLQPKSVCHVEFTNQHIRFKGDRLVKVIDWDEVSRDYMFYDLGTTMAECFTKWSINFDILNSIISGYEGQRKLTAWEGSHLFEALLFGISKFVIWGLDQEEIKKSGWNNIGLQQVSILIDMGRDKFNKRLLK